jgi:hypothetical protein
MLVVGWQVSVSVKRGDIRIRLEMGSESRYSKVVKDVPQKGVELWKLQLEE